MQNRRFYGIIISATLAILCIVSVQFFWLKNVWNSGKKEFEEKAYIALMRVAENVANLTNVQLPSLNIINRVTGNYYIVNINETIDANILEFYLKKELEKVNLKTDFEYGIYDCQTNKMMYGNYVGADFEVQKHPGTTLPTYDEFIYYFGIRFPKQKHFIYSAGWIPLVLSAILLLSICFLVYTLIEVFDQKRLTQMQKAFINSLAHELKTPLSSIKIGVEVLKTQDLKHNQERTNKYIDIIGKQSQLLEEQVNRVLNITKTGSQQFRIKKSHFSIVNCIQEVVANQTMKHHLRKEKITLQTSQDWTIYADHFHFTNMIKNLVENAIKYDPKDNPIQLNILQNGSKLQLSIKDNGSGIEKKYIKQLGKQFFRIHEDNIQKTDGFGLGLHYVYNIVKAHQWQIKINSIPQRGTCVTILIPYEKI